MGIAGETRGGNGGIGRIAGKMKIDSRGDFSFRRASSAEPLFFGQEFRTDEGVPPS